MKTIGITGGVGCGKSTVLSAIEKEVNALILYADDIARTLESPGYECYDDIVSLLGKDILDEDKNIDRGLMSKLIFSDSELLSKVNGIVHPAVKRYILKTIETENKRGKYDYLFLEAALLIQDGYDKILDELWYIKADRSVRISRLKESRGYSDEKISAILESQLKDEEYIPYCRVIIDNSGDFEETLRQIRRELKIGGSDELSGKSCFRT